MIIPGSLCADKVHSPGDHIVYAAECISYMAWDGFLPIGYGKLVTRIHNQRWRGWKSKTSGNAGEDGT